MMIRALRRLLNGTARHSRRRAGQIGYRLLSRPRRLPLNDQSAAFLKRARREKKTLGGIPTQTYYWPGPGPGVLLLHGWESCSGRWSDFYHSLRDAGFAIYAFDAPAHGRSGGKNFTVIEYTKVLADYLDQLPNPPVNWVGHSAGGMAILYYLSQQRGLISPERIVAMSVPAELTDFLDMFQRLLGLRETVVEGIEEEFTRRMQLTFKDISPRRYALDIKVPGLIMHDIDDDLARIGGAEAIYQNWENASLIITEGLGHSINSVEVVQLITEYLQLEEAELAGD